MKVRRVVLLNLVLLVVLAVAGYVRSQAAGRDRGREFPTPVTQSLAEASVTAPAAPAATPTPAQIAGAAPEDPPADGPSPMEPSVREPQSVASELATSALAASELEGDDDDSVPPLSRTVNILLLGSDRRPKQGDWRTDVLMILALDFESGQAGAISFPRDIYLEQIPGHRPNKINVVDFLGEQDKKGSGPELLASILTEKTGVPIHHYMRFDFESFKAVVDALGGVEIAVECRAWEYLPEEDITLLLEPGTHRLDGRMALGYVRARNQGGDLERARRQQRMVLAVRDQLLNENQLANLPALYSALRGAVQTDVGFIDAIRFARFGLALNPDSIHGIVLAPPELMKAGWRGGMSVFVADWPAIAAQMQTVLSRPPLHETNTIGQAGDRVECP